MKKKLLMENVQDRFLTALDDAPTRLDRFRIVLKYPILRGALNDVEAEYFRKIQKAFALSYRIAVESEAVSMIENSIEGAERRDYAWQIFKDMHFVYDEFMDSNKELENNLYVARQRDLAMEATKLAETSQDFDYVSKIEERAAKAGGFVEPPKKIEGERPLPKLLIITSDRSALESQKKGERADFEELIEDDGDSTGEI